MRIYILVPLLALVASLACVAADNPKVALEAKDMPIEQAMANLGKQADVQIICDAGLKNVITGHFESIDLESLLDNVTKTNDLKWQKVYLPADPEKKPTLEQIKARIDAVAALTGGAIVVSDPATGKQRVFMEQDPAAPSVQPDKLSLKPVYLVLKPKVEAKDTSKDKAKQDSVAQYQSLEAERTKLLAQMTPEQRVVALQQEMMSTLNQDPATRQQMMMDQMKARESMDPQTRDQLRQAMHDTFQAMRDQGLIPNDAHHSGGGRHGGGGQ